MKTCALVAAVDFNADQFKMRDARGDFDMVIAVDGGLASLQSINRSADIAVGDFDSLGYVPTTCEVVEFPSKKDASDLACAFRIMQQAGCKRAVVFGALGGRLDHTVGNLQVSAAMSEVGIDVKLIGSDGCVQLLTGPRNITLPAIEQGVVSVFSLSECAQGVCIEGLEYPLLDEQLVNRTSWGLSNEYVGKSANISVKEGTLAVFLPFEACL